MEKVIVFGSGGHAKTVIDILEKQKLYEILGVFTDDLGKVGPTFFDYPVLGKIDDFYGSDKGILALGYNFKRYQVAEKILKVNPNFTFIKAIHPSAVIGRNVTIGDGTVVVGGVVINPSARIGNHCVINTKASVGHDVTVGDYSTIAPGATLGGFAVIGELSRIALGASVIQRITVGSGSLVGAGATVVRDIPDGVLAYGVPAKVIRKRKFDEKF